MKERNISHLSEHDQRIVLVGRKIKMVPNKYDQDRWGFIDYINHTCETVGCVAGWAVAMFGDERGISAHYGSIPDYAGELLNLKHGGRSPLFNSYWPTRYLKHIEPDRDLECYRMFTPSAAQAAQILEAIGFGELTIHPEIDQC